MFRFLTALISTTVLLFSPVPEQGANKVLFSRQVYSEYLGGEYKKCADYGETLIIEDLYDAFVAAVSSIANHKLAYSEIRMFSQNNQYYSNGARAEIIGANAISFLREHFEEIDSLFTSNSVPKEYLFDFLDVFIECCQQIGSKQYYTLMKKTHEYYNSISPGQLSLEEQLRRWFYEAKFNLDRRRVGEVIYFIVPQFELLVNQYMLQDGATFNSISAIYQRMSVLISDLVSNSSGTYMNNSYMKDLSCNMIIRGHEYEFSSGDKETVRTIGSLSWKGIKEKLPPSTLACIYYEHAERQEERMTEIENNLGR